MAVQALSTEDSLLVDNDFLIKSNPHQLFHRRQVEAVYIPGGLGSPVYGLEWSSR